MGLGESLNLTGPNPAPPPALWALPGGLVRVRATLYHIGLSSNSRHLQSITIAPSHGLPSPRAHHTHSGVDMRVYSQSHTRTCTHTLTNTRSCSLTHSHAHTRTCTYTQTHMHALRCVRTHSLTHTHAHTHSHTVSPPPSCLAHAVLWPHLRPADASASKARRRRVF